MEPWGNIVTKILYFKDKSMNINTKSRTLSEMELRKPYIAADSRYDQSHSLYRRCGRSGVLLPK